MIKIEEAGGVNLAEWRGCISVVENTVPGVALYEQLAEEAAELAQAALKVARIGRGDSPTPMTLVEAMEHFREELADLAVVCEVLAAEPDKAIMMAKLRRWKERVRGGGDDA